MNPDRVTVSLDEAAREATDASGVRRPRRRFGEARDDPASGGSA